MHVHPEGSDGLVGVDSLEADDPFGRDLSRGPAGLVEPPRRAALSIPLDQPVDECVAEADGIDRMIASGLAQGGHRCRQARRGKSAARQSALTPMPTTSRGSSVPSPSVSPRTPASLRGPAAVRLDDEVVWPLQADRSVGQAGDLFRRGGHGERRGRHHAPGAIGWQPGGSKPEREQEPGAGWRDPRPAGPTTAGGLLIGDCEADLGRARLEPVANDVVRRADPLEPLKAREEFRHQEARR